MWAIVGIWLFIGLVAMGIGRVNCSEPGTPEIHQQCDEEKEKNDKLVKNVQIPIIASITMLIYGILLIAGRHTKKLKHSVNSKQTKYDSASTHLI